MPLRSSLLAVVCCLATLPLADLVAQETATIESLGYLTTNNRRSFGRRVSGDGRTIVGWSNGANGKPHGFRWTVEGGMQHLAPNALDDESDAYGVSDDGSIVVGTTYGASRNSNPARWTPDGTLEEPYAPETFVAAAAWGLSGDGQVAVGYGAPAIRMNSHAYRFGDSREPYDLGTIGAFDGISEANDASYDGSVIVGVSDTTDRDHGFIWTAQTGVQKLGDLDASSEALAVSDDGSVVVGACSPGLSVEFAFHWNATDGMQRLANVEGQTGRASANDVSADGSVIVGRCAMPGGETYSNRGTACIWRDGVAKSLWDLLENEYPADLEGWSELTSVEGVSADGKTLTGHGLYRGDQSAFRVVLGNTAPEIDPIEPLTVECQGETNEVVLSTTVRDNGSRVTVRWIVADEVVKTETNVVPGQTDLTWNFADGETNVRVEATDGDLTTTAETIVTVVDTVAPIVTVAENVVVPTDARKRFASNVTLPPPQVFDVCDGEPSLTNDAPERFQLGTTTVTWTATDADGNVSTTTQRVTVKDREAPRLREPKDVRLFCDPGEIFATADLVPPRATDNVSDDLLVQTSAGPRFRIGKTRVVWTARDEAGNVAKTTMFVTVVNRPPQADAGDRVDIDAKRDRAVKVRLDGRGSSDPDDHALKYFWSASGIVFSNPTSARPIGSFPIGTTTATLTVTDEGGAKASAKVQVVVRLANSAERPRGAAANRAFEAALDSATKGASTGRLSVARSSALVHTQATAVLGTQAGDRVVWEEDGSPVDASIDYATLRAAQALQGAAAARAWLSAYAEEGDEASLVAALDALRGLGYAQADLIEP